MQISGRSLAASDSSPKRREPCQEPAPWRISGLKDLRLAAAAAEKAGRTLPCSRWRAPGW